MANASAKRIAGQNERAIRNLRIGMVVSLTLSFFLRLFFRRQFFASTTSILVYALTFLPTTLLYSFLVRTGTPTREVSGGILTPGVDLNQAGVTEWSWDIIYITWACQIGSSAFGEWVWWLYLTIPIYAGFKIWNSFIRPFVLGRSSEGRTENKTNSEFGSKRQEKLRKRQEKGDPRVHSIPNKK